MQAKTNLKQVVVRISPITGQPVIFDALSRAEGQLKMWVGDAEKTVGLDFYAAAHPMDDEVAKQVVQTFAEQHNIPLESIVVRHRLPKSNAATVSLPRMRKQRTTNDSNLVLVKDENKPSAKARQDGKQESSQDYRSKNEVEGKSSDFQNTVQQMHDAATNKRHEQKASADKPEGDVVNADKKRVKRNYTKMSKQERSARSKAAYERYQTDLKAALEKNPEVLEPIAEEVAQASDPSVPQEQHDDAILELAKAIAKVLKSGML